jgi:hypothetical protein
MNAKVTNGFINCLHSFVSAVSITTITAPLFDKEMQYLHDNGFKVLLLNQFGFNPTNNLLYLKDFPSSRGTATNVVSAYGTYSHLDEMSQRSRSSNAVNFAMNRQ